MALRDLISTVASRLQKGKENLGDWMKVAINPSQRQDYVQNVVQPTFEKIKNIPQTVANVAQMTTNPYGRTQISNYVQSKIAPHIGFSKEDFYGTYQPSPQEQKLYDYDEQTYEMNHPTIVSQSGQLRPYFEKPQPDAKAQALRDLYLRQANYTPQVEQYIRYIPFIEMLNGDKTWASGTARGGTGAFVDINPNTYDMARYNDQVTGHELGHQINFVQNKFKPEDFIEAYNNAVQNNPEQMAPIVKWINNYQTDQPQYFNNYGYANQEEQNKRLASELYAEIASRYGSQVLNNPSLAKYYQGVFKQPAPTPENTGSGYGVGQFLINKKVSQPVKNPVKFTYPSK